MSRALDLALAQKNSGKTIQQIADEIGKGRTAVSLWIRGVYPANVSHIEAAILKTYDRRICPADGREKQPEQCRRIALAPCPHGFTDAESTWRICQSCPHKPEVTK